MVTQSVLSKKHDTDACQELEASSPVGLPESLNISSDLEIVPLIPESDNSQPGGEASSTKHAQPVKDLMSLGKPTDTRGLWHSGYDDAASTSLPPAPLAFEDKAPVLTSTSKKDKKSTKKGKNT